MKQPPDATVVRLAPGESLTVQLQSIPSAGYGWEITGLPAHTNATGPEYLKLGEERDPEICGAPSIEQFLLTFDAHSPAGAVELQYRRPWLPHDEPLYRCQITLLGE